MEKKLNSYYGSANNDYLYAKANLDVGKVIGNYNNVASLAAISAEKFMKAIIEVYDLNNEESIELLKTHNLRRLLKRIKILFPSCQLDVMKYKWLGDFYFDARYPGDNFVEVDEEEGILCIRLLEELKIWIDITDRTNTMQSFD